MEAFSLLKYWRGGGGGGGGGGGNGLVPGDAAVNVRTTTGTTTIVTAVTQQATETDDEDDDDDDDDDGPFFDLEFAVPDEDDAEESGVDGDKIHQEQQNANVGDYVVEEEEENDDGDENDDGVESTGSDGEEEFKFTLSSASSGDRTDANLGLSPSDDLFFKGSLVPIDSSSIVINSPESNSKTQFPVSLLKSATKFRVFMLGLKKSKTEANGGSVSATPKAQQKQEHHESQSKQKSESQQQQQQEISKFFTVKFKVEEVPIVSLFTRDSSRSASSNNNSKSQKQQQQQQQLSSSEDSGSEEKRLISKEVVQKYLKKVKPLYVRVSKRYGEKMRFSGQLSSLTSGDRTIPPQSTVTTQTTKSSVTTEPVTEEGPAANNVKSQKLGLSVVRKHLGKSRSGSSAVAAAPSGSGRRDDSLLQQQDGIQSAILHCKRSFNASRDSILARCGNNNNNNNNNNGCSSEKLTDLSRSYSEKVKGSSSTPR